MDNLKKSIENMANNTHPPNEPHLATVVENWANAKAEYQSTVKRRAHMEGKCFITKQEIAQADAKVEETWRIVCRMKQQVLDTEHQIEDVIRDLRKIVEAQQHDIHALSVRADLAERKADVFRGLHKGRK